MILNYSKTKNVKHPTRANSTDAGIDFYVPEFTDEFKKKIKELNSCVSTLIPGSYSYDILDNKILLGPGQRLLIPSGIRTMGNPNTALIFHNKSGISSKKGLDILACVIDESYNGILHINIVNTSLYNVEICENEKLAQLIEFPIYTSELIEVPEEEILNRESTRGEGGFGSTR